MKQGFFTVVENKPLTGKVSRLVLKGDVSAIERPGQFVQLRLSGLYLRRPFSVCDRDADSFTVLFETVGKGTGQLQSIEPSVRLDVLTGLGNGFDLNVCGDAPLLIGGGTGVSPLYWLAKELLSQGKHPMALLGFNTVSDVFYEDEYRALGIETVVTTVDGSYGVEGFVTNAMARPHSGFFTCGPEAMMKAVCACTDKPGQLSFDKRMGCGFGACMGCTVKTGNGLKRICKDGPVLDREEVLWED
ncbi:MAG: dihydroorotate dehydrogenase electron transfer subunit [Oscillospiraceae bacterium]|nr:dihydroorotate dehydrogenase electron transfer subunit [Oscillospiraceae bacterium]